MAVLWLSGSAEPGASVNVAPAEEKSLVSWCCEQHGEGEGRGPELVGRGERSWCKRSWAGRELGVLKRPGQALRTVWGSLGGTCSGRL